MIFGRGISLVGHFLKVDPNQARDFDMVYKGRYGVSSEDTVIVTRDNRGTPLDGSGIRIIEFANAQGKSAGGNASRFGEVIYNSGAWTGRTPGF